MISHELGHKYYENCVKSLAKSKSMEYNKTKKIIDSQIEDYISNNNLTKNDIGSKLGEYAKKKYSQGKYTELIAESFSAYDHNPLAKDFIDMLEANSK